MREQRAATGTIARQAQAVAGRTTQVVGDMASLSETAAASESAALAVSAAASRVSAQMQALDGSIRSFLGKTAHDAELASVGSSSVAA
jgi:hypothetical protein